MGKWACRWWVRVSTRIGPSHTPLTQLSHGGGGVYDGVSLGQVVGESVHPDRTLTHGS